MSRGYESEEFMSPKYYPSAEEFSDKLENNGFKVESIELFERPTPLSFSENVIKLVAVLKEPTVA